MLRVNRVTALGVLLSVATPAYGRAQMVGRSGSTSAPVTAPRPSTLPPIRMGSLPQSGIDGRFRGDFGRFDGTGRWPGRGFDHRRSIFSPGFSFGARALIGSTYVTETVVPYAVPYYVPVPYPARLWQPTPQSETPAKPYDPKKSKMLTIGEGADGGGGVMRIEAVNDSVLRLTWLGTARPIREARLFVADSAQRPLRSALVDDDTPSALFQIADVKAKIAYTGLTIAFADGAVQTTLVPYQKTSQREP
jgi:hypothetical protein